MPDTSRTQLQDWIDRMNAGDLSARDDLIKHSYPQLRRLTSQMFLGFSRLKPWADIDDVLQNALIRLLRVLQAVRITSVREFFLLTSAQIRRELLDLTRHCFGPEGSGTWRAAHLVPNSSEAGAQPSQNKPDSTEEADLLAQWSEFHQQVEALPVEEREVFSLLWYHGMTQAEAAEVLNVSKSTIKRWSLSAQLRLGEALKGEWPGC